MAFCEVDPFPCAVLAHRYPDIPNLGDVREVDWLDFAPPTEGQMSLWGEAPASRSASPGPAPASRGPQASCGSTFELFRSCVLDASSGRTSRARCRARTGRISDACSQAWMSSGTVSQSVLDAQFFGVAQRRRRLFVVGFPGDGGRSAACEVLLERACVPWDPRPGQRKEGGACRPSWRRR